MFATNVKRCHVNNKPQHLTQHTDPTQTRPSHIITQRLFYFLYHICLFLIYISTKRNRTVLIMVNKPDPGLNPVLEDFGGLKICRLATRP